MKRLLFLLTTALISAPSVAFAQDKINSGDTAWMIAATALVMVMTPAGLALFYGGMSRQKNLLNTFGMTYAAYCLASVVWMLWGYPLAFGDDCSGIIGSLAHVFMNGILPSSVSGSIPTYIFAVFQLTFAAITVALVLGSIVDRLKFSSWLIFTVLWVTVVYCPIAHWVWGGGWLAKLGALDFAGGTVVHINAGVAGLIFCLFLGKRIGYGKEPMFPSSVTLTALGSALLWFGWFGFNAGSELAADGIACSAFLVTNTAAATAAMAWMFMEWLVEKKPTILGIASGAVAGLVAITPASGFVDMKASLVIGLGAGVLGFVCVAWLKKKLGYDDSLDAFGVHAMCGMWGAVATGIFANPAINPAGTGLLYGNPKQVIIQIVAVLATISYAAIATVVVILITKVLTGGIRVNREEEIKGLDSELHGERAFELHTAAG